MDYKPFDECMQSGLLKFTHYIKKYCYNEVIRELWFMSLQAPTFTLLLGDKTDDYCKEQKNHWWFLFATLSVWMKAFLFGSSDGYALYGCCALVYTILWKINITLFVVVQTPFYFIDGGGKIS